MKKPVTKKQSPNQLAWQRINDLAEAIIKQYERNIRSASLVKSWAKEIVMQCDIINSLKDERSSL